MKNGIGKGADSNITKESYQNLIDSVFHCGVGTQDDINALFIAATKKIENDDKEKTASDNDRSVIIDRIAQIYANGGTPSYQILGSFNNQAQPLFMVYAIHKTGFVPSLLVDDSEMLFGKVMAEAFSDELIEHSEDIASMLTDPKKLRIVAETALEGSYFRKLKNIKSVPIEITKTLSKDELWNILNF